MSYKYPSSYHHEDDYRLQHLSSQPTRSYLRPPSKSANTPPPPSSSYHRSGGDETWPLDEVIEKIDIKSDVGSEDTDFYHQNTPNYNKNVQTWHSGPQLISETSNSFKESKRIPGEGAIFSSFTEGSRTWKDKQIQHREINSKRGSQYDLNRSKFKKSYDNNNNYINDSAWNDSLAQDVDLDDGFAEAPTLRDVAIQCSLGRKKLFGSTVSSSNNLGSLSSAPTNQPYLLPDNPYVTKKPPIKVIKSNHGTVSAFSDVPKLSSASHQYQYLADQGSHDSSFDLNSGGGPVYSQVNKRVEGSGYHKNDDLNIVYKQPLNETSFTSNRSNLSQFDDNYQVRSKQYGFNVSSSPGPKINLYDPLLSGSNYRNSTPNTEKEIIEETISLSASASTSDTESMIVHDAPKRDNHLFGNMKKSSVPPLVPVKLPASSRNYTNPSGFGTIELSKSKDKKSHLSKKKGTKNLYENQDTENVMVNSNSLRLKSSKSPVGSMTSGNHNHRPPLDRLYKSNVDLNANSDASSYHDETRGGLAAAYKNRQLKQQNPRGNPNHHRALSLSRMHGSASPDVSSDVDVARYPPVVRHLSHSHLNVPARTGSSRTSMDSDGSSAYHQQRGRRSNSSRQPQHERDPIVMYIPPTPTTSRSITESPKLTGILRNNSSKNLHVPTSTLTKSKSKSKDGSKLSSSRGNLKDTSKDTKTNKKTKNNESLNRSQSMPKDSKINWFSKFKLNSKSNK